MLNERTFKGILSRTKFHVYAPDESAVILLIVFYNCVSLEVKDFATHTSVSNITKNVRALSPHTYKIIIEGEFEHERIKDN